MITQFLLWAFSITLSYSFNIKICLTHDTSPSDINAVNSHEGICHRLASVSEQWVGEIV